VKRLLQSHQGTQSAAMHTMCPSKGAVGPVPGGQASSNSTVFIHCSLLALTN